MCVVQGPALKGDYSPARAQSSDLELVRLESGDLNMTKAPPPMNGTSCGIWLLCMCSTPLRVS